jgi:hypothetical protein
MKKKFVFYWVFVIFFPVSCSRLSLLFQDYLCIVSHNFKVSIFNGINHHKTLWVLCFGSVDYPIRSNAEGA